MKTIFPLKTWPFWQQILAKEPELEVFVVGGAVRDALLNKTPKDIDFVARGIALEKLIDLLNDYGRVDLVGKRFGVIKFRPNQEEVQYDIALPRTERSLSFSGAYRDFEIQSDPFLSIEEDLARRDFTINAMAYNIQTEELIDPFFGRKDLESKLIRTVGAAVTRFQEDYSRMLRAIRFSCQLDFLMTEKVETTIHKLAPHLQDKINDEWIVSREVIASEFLKALDANPVKLLQLSNKLTLLELLLPEVKQLESCEQSPPYHLEGSVFNHVIRAFKMTNSAEYRSFFPDPIPVLSKIGILFHDLGKPHTSTTDEKGRIHFYGHAQKGAEIASKICKRLRLGGSEYASFKCEHLSWIVKHHLFSIDDKNSPVPFTKLEELFFSDRYPSQSLLHVMLADLLGSQTEESIDHLAPFTHLWGRLQEMAPNGTLPDPLLTGDDILKELKIKPGPEIKSLLTNVREAQLTKKIMTKKEALLFLKSHEL